MYKSCSKKNVLAAAGEAQLVESRPVCGCGFDPRSEHVWRTASRRFLSRICFSLPSTKSVSASLGEDF